MDKPNRRFPVWEAAVFLSIVSFLGLLLFSPKKVNEKLDELGIKKISAGGVSFERFDRLIKEAYADQKLQPPSAAAQMQIRNLRDLLGPIVIGRRVLWVDDNPHGNRAIRTLLLTYGVETQISRSTDEAMQELKKDIEGYDIVISDWARQEKDAGTILLQKIREEKDLRIKNVPFIVYHGSLGKQEQDERDNTSRSKGAIGATVDPLRLLRWVMGQLTREALVDERKEVLF
jgi:CheY-like chemotaxis protein